jgi:DNA-binding CsgD family transcriptional regulator
VSRLTTSPTGRRGIASVRHARRGDEHELLRASDVALLRWLSEQYGARADQLLVLLGCSERTVQRTLTRLRAAGVVQVQRFLAGEPAWVMPTSAGLRLSGHGFSLWRPHLALLAHVAAVNDVRLHVEQRSPHAEWVSERLLARERESAREHLVDALVIEGRRRIAIEVELTVKSHSRITSILDELAERYDAILYYCAPAPQRQLEKLAASGRWPTLGVRELPRSHS